MLNHWPVVEDSFLDRYLDFLGECFFPGHFDGKWTHQLKCHQLFARYPRYLRTVPIKQMVTVITIGIPPYHDMILSIYELLRVIAFYHPKLAVGQPPMQLGNEDPITLRNSWAERIGPDASFSSCACCRFCAACAWPAILALRLSFDVWCLRGSSLGFSNRTVFGH